jgi:ABC-type sugar transport system ATPase subunit
MTLTRLSARSVGKRYAGVRALEDVSLDLQPGEVHSLLGQNGSGKSTLVKILSGAVAPSHGELRIGDDRVTLHSPARARALGIAVVHQDFHVFPHLDVAANIAGLESENRSGILSRKEVRRRAARALESLGRTLPLDVPASRLGPGDWKIIEFARVLARRPRYLILDEPTASLDKKDTLTVLSLIGELRRDSIGVLLVTHRLEEAIDLSDRITVLRDGHAVASAVPRRDVSALRLAELIAGGRIGEPSERSTESSGQREVAASGQVAALQLRGVKHRDEAEPFDLTLHSGEILAVTGLEGSGYSDVGRMLIGDAAMTGAVGVGPSPTRLRSPREAARHGIGLIPEDRIGAGIIPGMSVALNICIGQLRAVSVGPFLHRGRIRKLADQYIRALAIRGPGPNAPARTLSGGNQQKVLLARWFALNPSILVLEAPTHGIDVGAKYEVEDQMRRFTEHEGGAILLTTTDMAEAVSLADRVAVMNNGELADVVDTTQVSHSEVLLRGTHSSWVRELEKLSTEVAVGGELATTAVDREHL